LPLFLGAGFCLGAMDALAKLTIPLLGVLAVVWARYVSQAIVVAAWAWRRGGPGFWRTRHPALQLGRSTLLLTATACFYAALRYLPLAEASAISFVSPVVVVLLAPWLLGERTRRSQLAAAAAGFVGVLIVLRPGGSVFHPAALLLFGTAVCVALYVPARSRATRRTRRSSTARSPAWSSSPRSPPGSRVAMCGHRRTRCGWASWDS
jgi:drug/metabolite transporter (DMT)-like permease